MPVCVYIYNDYIWLYDIFCFAQNQNFNNWTSFEDLLTFKQTYSKSVSIYFWKTKLSASRSWGFESSCTIRARSTSRSGGRRMLKFLDVGIAQVEEGWLDVWMCEFLGFKQKGQHLLYFVFMIYEVFPRLKNHDTWIYDDIC